MPECKTLTKKRLDVLYAEYNNKQYIPFDPIKYVYQFEDRKERELVALISSCFSFGRVLQIFKAMDRLLDIFNHQPFKYVMDLGPCPEKELLSFKYRFVTGLDVFNLLSRAKKIIENSGSIGNFAEKQYKEGQLAVLANDMIHAFQGVHYLIPSSLKTSPCKRLFMFLRWMVRDDNIDLGFWKFINPQELVIPLDTHIFRTAKDLGFTKRRTASLKTAVEITNYLKRYSKHDPVKYDWSLSHIGIIANNFPTEPKKES